MQSYTNPFVDIFLSSPLILSNNCVTHTTLCILFSARERFNFSEKYNLPSSFFSSKFKSLSTFPFFLFTFSPFHLSLFRRRATRHHYTKTEPQLFPKKNGQDLRSHIRAGKKTIYYLEVAPDTNSGFLL